MKWSWLISLSILGLAASCAMEEEVSAGDDYIGGGGDTWGYDDVFSLRSQYLGHICNGVLVGRREILTTSGCANNMSYAMGEWGIAYQKQAVVRNGPLAMIRVDRNVYEAAPRRVSTSYASALYGDRLAIAGWGSGNKKYATVNVTATSGDYIRFIAEDGAEGGAACAGDDGTPVFEAVNGDTRNIQLVGILTRRGACTRQSPHDAVTLRPAMSWIAANRTP